MGFLLNLEQPPHSLLKPGLPRSLLGVAVREVAEVSDDVGTVGGKGGFTHACLVNLRDDRD